MTCPARLPGPSRLPCQRTDPHPPHEGCVYVGDDFHDLVHHDTTED